MAVDGRGHAAGRIAALAVLPIVIAAIHGCTQARGPAGQGPPPEQLLARDKDAPGHVYPARLMSEHPMYPMLLRLGSRADALCGPAVDLAAPAWHAPTRPTYPVTLLPPSVPIWNRDALGVLVSDAVASVSDPTATVDVQFPPDLRARMRWIERSAGAERDRAIQAARYERELTLARRRAELVKKYQEALMNVDLPPTRRVETDQDAAPGRSRLEAAIDAQMQQAQAEADDEFRLYAEGVTQEARERIAAAQREIADEMRKRQETSVSSGSKTVDQLSKALKSVEGADYSVGAMDLTLPEADPRGVENGSSGADFTDLYRAAGHRVADDIERQRAKLRRTIYADTVLAVRKCALQAGMEIRIPPLQAAEGADLTETMRPSIRRMWAAGALPDG